MIESKMDITLLSREIKHSADALCKSHQIRLLTMQLHLLLVDFTHIENLIHQVQNALRIVLNSVNSRITLPLNLL